MAWEASASPEESLEDCPLFLFGGYSRDLLHVRGKYSGSHPQKAYVYHCQGDEIQGSSRVVLSSITIRVATRMDMKE